MRNARTDGGSIVIGWLVKVALVLSVLGVAGFDAISVASANLSTSDDANSAASAAAADFRTSHNAASALAAAEDAITNPNETLVKGSLSIAPDGTVSLQVERTITTVVMRHIGPLKKYTVVKATGEAAPPTL